MEIDLFSVPTKEASSEGTLRLFSQMFCPSVRHATTLFQDVILISGAILAGGHQVEVIAGPTHRLHLSEGNRPSFFGPPKKTRGSSSIPIPSGKLT